MRSSRPTTIPDECANRDALEYYIRQCNDNGVECCLEVLAAVSTGSVSCSLTDRVAPLRDMDIRCICLMLRRHNVLQILNIEGNAVEQDGVLAVANMLKQNTSIHTIRMGANRFRDGGCITLSHALKVNSTLTSLDLSHSRIGTVGCKALAQELASPSCSLREVVLHGNTIEGSAVAYLCDRLRANRTLQHLHLGHNDIGEKGAVALGGLLRSNTALATLDIESNRVGDVGGAAIFDALASHPSTGLKRLNMRSNRLGSHTFLACARCFERGKVGVEEVYLGFNAPSAEALQQVLQAACHATALTVLDVQGCTITDISILCKLVLQNQRLTRLLIDGVQCRDEMQERTMKTAWTETLEARREFESRGWGPVVVGREDDPRSKGLLFTVHTHYSPQRHLSASPSFEMSTAHLRSVLGSSNGDHMSETLPMKITQSRSPSPPRRLALPSETSVARTHEGTVVVSASEDTEAAVAAVLQDVEDRHRQEHAIQRQYIRGLELRVKHLESEAAYAWRSATPPEQVARDTPQEPKTDAPGCVQQALPDSTVEKVEKVAPPPLRSTKTPMVPPTTTPVPPVKRESSPMAQHPESAVWEGAETPTDAGSRRRAGRISPEQIYGGQPIKTVKPRRPRRMDRGSDATPSSPTRTAESQSTPETPPSPRSPDKGSAAGAELSGRWGAPQEEDMPYGSPVDPLKVTVPQEVPSDHSGPRTGDLHSSATTDAARSHSHATLSSRSRASGQSAGGRSSPPPPVNPVDLPSDHVGTPSSSAARRSPLDPVLQHPSDTAVGGRRTPLDTRPADTTSGGDRFEGGGKGARRSPAAPSADGRRSPIPRTRTPPPSHRPESGKVSPQPPSAPYPPSQWLSRAALMERTTGSHFLALRPFNYLAEAGKAYRTSSTSARPSVAFGRSATATILATSPRREEKPTELEGADRAQPVPLIRRKVEAPANLDDTDVSRMTEPQAPPLLRPLNTTFTMQPSHHSQHRTRSQSPTARTTMPSAALQEPSTSDWPRSRSACHALHQASEDAVRGLSPCRGPSRHRDTRGEGGLQEPRRRGRSPRPQPAGRTSISRRTDDSDTDDDLPTTKCYPLAASEVPSPSRGSGPAAWWNKENLGSAHSSKPRSYQSPPRAHSPRHTNPSPSPLAVCNAHKVFGRSATARVFPTERHSKDPVTTYWEKADSHGATFKSSSVSSTSTTRPPSQSPSSRGSSPVHDLLAPTVKKKQKPDAGSRTTVIAPGKASIPRRPRGPARRD